MQIQLSFLWIIDLKCAEGACPPIRCRLSHNSFSLSRRQLIGSSELAQASNQHPGITIHGPAKK